MHYKKQTLALVVAVLAALPAQAQAATTASPTQQVTADITSTLEVSGLGGQVSFGELTPASTEESSQQTLTVRSNATWGVKVYDGDEDTAGRLTKFTAGDYTDDKLKNALQHRVAVDALAGESYVPLPTDAPGVGQVALQPITDDDGTPVVTQFQQTASYEDPSAGADDYRLVVNYDVSQAF